MCGIAGLISKSSARLDETLFRKALQQLIHRGPDDGGIYLAPNNSVLLGHRRLAIMDTSSLSAQPFCEAEYVLLFNGAIFNFKELRDELARLGHEFRTKGDTEVVLKSYIQWGESCFAKFNGFFAIAIYNEKKDELVLARDRYGEKPLLMYENSSYIAFASEMRVFLSLNFPLTLSQQVIPMYFAYTFIPEPYTIFEEVKKIEPGAYYIIRKKDKKQQFYYKLEPAKEEKMNDKEQAIDTLKNLLEDSVKRRLYADVPISVFLSSGIDSTVVTYIAAKVKPDIEAYTIGFSDTPYYDESELASKTAQQLGIKHTVVDVTDKMMEENVREVLYGLDEPYADSSAIAAYTLFKAVKSHYRVVLTGDGGDEIFGGYRKHRAWARVRHIPRWQLQFLKFFFHLPLPEHRSSGFADLVRKTKKFVQLAEVENKFKYDFLARFNSIESIRELLLFYELQPFIQEKILDENDFLKKDFQFVLVSDMLHKIDSMSMLNSVEARAPLLDYRLVDYVFSLPGTWKFDHRAGKKLLREAFQHELPAHVLHGRKRGFEVPLWKWLPQLIKKNSVLFDDGFIKRQGIFNLEQVSVLQKIFESEKVKKHQFLLFSYLVFQSWYLNYYGE